MCIIIPSEAFWAVASFIIGVVFKCIFNVFVTPKIKIFEDIVPDTKTKKPYIKVSNISRFRWNKAYDLHFYLTYYYHKTDGEFEPFRIGLIDDGVITPAKSEKYSITPKGESDYNIESNDYKVGIVLIYRNRFGTYSIVEQTCCPDTRAIKTSVRE